LVGRYALYMNDTEFDILFKRFDPDGGGEVDYDEFVRYFGAVMQPKEEGGIAYDMQLNKPINTSGYNDKTVAQKGLSPTAVMAILGKKVAEQFTHVQKAFRSLDEDFSGSIGPDEFRQLLTR